MVPPLNRIADHGEGFTLVELLISMTLLSMVTLVVAMALRLAIDSWERGSNEGEGVQVSTVIPSLMEKQLGCLVRDDPFENHSKGLLPFCGQDHGLSFFTSYAPQGSPLQGLLRVSYVFQEAEQTLYFFEQAITKKENLDDEFNPLSGDWKNGLVSVGQVNGIKDFSLTYTDHKTTNPWNEGDWKSSWRCGSALPPVAVSVCLQTASESKSRSRKWVFALKEGLP